jgi:hypothetical protein
MTIPAGQMGNEQPILIVTETWYSPDLQAMVLTKHDPRNGETVTKLMNISRSEPPHMLFEAPADFKVTESERGMPRPRAATAPANILPRRGGAEPPHSRRPFSSFFQLSIALANSPGV